MIPVHIEVFVSPKSEATAHEIETGVLNYLTAEKLDYREGPIRPPRQAEPVLADIDEMCVSDLVLPEGLKTVPFAHAAHYGTLPDSSRQTAQHASSQRST